ncbi:MAG: hypothetical protein HOW73_30420 [Polyangiaceae bacterium]|nr:hypothetical protein [Polyangiaceae bacterium]
MSRSAKWLTIAIAIWAFGCGDDENGGSGSEGGAASGGDSQGGAPLGGAAEGGSANGGASDGGAADGGAPTDGGGGSGGGSSPVCTEERTEALGPIDTMSTGDVIVLDEEDGAATLFVDASAGGIQEQANNPWIYLDLATLEKVAVTDVSADADTAWDLAIKRPVVRTNSGDGGYAGEGGAVRLDAAFDDVTSADANAAFETEGWFDADCTLKLDAGGAISTTFDGWYEYDNTVVSPGGGTWLVRAGDGVKVFKLEILDYYSNPDGSSGTAGGRYRLRVAEVTP